MGTLFTLFTTLVGAKIPYTKDTYNTPAYFYREGGAKNLTTNLATNFNHTANLVTHLRILNYRMSVSNCRCWYTKLQAPLQPLVPDAAFPRPLYLKLNLTASLRQCLDHKSCRGDVLSVLSKAGAKIMQPTRTLNLRFGNSTFTVSQSTFKIKESRIQAGATALEQGRVSFIPSLRKINKHLTKVFKRIRITLYQARRHYWQGVIRFYKGHHWVPKSKVILRLDFDHECVLRSKIRRPSLLYESGHNTSFQCMMQPLPFRGSNLTFKHRLSHVYKVGKMYLANLDNPIGHSTYPPYMNVYKPYNCPFLLAPVNIGVTTCRVKVLKHYLLWRSQRKFYTRYPTYIHFLRACQEYAREPYLGHKIKEGSFDGTLPTFEFQPDKRAIRLAKQREGYTH